MALNLFQVKRWIKMISGRSIEHVNQDIGRSFDKEEVKGYYNNLIDKVLFQKHILETEELPVIKTQKGELVEFPVAIFQYALGAYDLWLQTGNKVYINKFMQCADWALYHQDNLGRWENFFFVYPEFPYGSMAQGEGASVLIRAFKYKKDKKYLQGARKALDFMLLPLEDGGTTKIVNGNYYLMEYTNLGMVLNGAIFSWWGLYDYIIETKDCGKYQHALEETLRSLVEILPLFRSNYWSEYSLDKEIASPFYHNLHIAQMQAMYVLTGKPIFDEYAQLWKKRQDNKLCKSFAFLRKAFQKIIEK